VVSFKKTKAGALIFGVDLGFFEKFLEFESWFFMVLQSKIGFSLVLSFC